MATAFAIVVFLLAGFSTKQVCRVVWQAKKFVPVHTQYARCLQIMTAFGYYCDSDKCGIDKYCCGVNICCTSYAAWQLWYFWCGIVFFMFLLSACACFCRYRYYHTAIIVHQHANPYARLDTNPDHQYPTMPVSDGQYTDTPLPFGQGNKQKYSQDYPPPTYAQSTGIIEKDPNYCR